MCVCRSSRVSSSSLDALVPCSPTSVCVCVGAGAHIASGFDLGMDYYNFAVPIVDEQLAKGGIRLAYLLNNIFSS